MNKYRSSIVSLVLTLLVVLASCASHKHTVTPISYQPNERFVAKFRADVSGQGMEVNDVNGQIRVCYDSVLWLSASAFGREMVRAMMINDSVFLVNRFDKTYVTESTESLVPVLHDTIRLQDAQRILFGKPSNEPVYLQFGSYKAILHYESINLDPDLTFPFKINSNYERIIP